MELSERTAIVETELTHLNNSLNELKSEFRELATLVRKHMEDEEEDRDTLLTRLTEIEIAQAKMSSFRAGIVATVSLIWAVGVAVVYFFGKSPT